MISKRKGVLSTDSGLLETLLADLGKDYDPEGALKFLKILESEAQSKNINKTNVKTTSKGLSTEKTKQEIQNIQLAKNNLNQLFKNPPNEDVSLHTIYKTPYVLGEIVLAGKNTRDRHPLCNFYPIHFKKTYLKQLSRWETNPSHEARQSHKIWKHFQEISDKSSSTEKETATEPPKSCVPLPVGSDPSTYRSQLLEAVSLGAISPINSNANAEELSKQILQAKKSYGSIKKLWKALESLDQRAQTLHNGGFLHNDLHKENLLIRNHEDEPEGCIIDFETSEEDERFNTLEWSNATLNDKRYLIKEACLIFLCGPKNEQLEILAQKDSALSKNISHALKSDPLLLSIQKLIGNPLTLDPNKSLETTKKDVRKIRKPNSIDGKDISQ